MNTVITSREAILEVSKSIAATEGLNGINMRTVAAGCGVAVGSVYNYFPSKSELLSATVEDIWKDIFHYADGSGSFIRFTEAVSWLFSRIRDGTKEYPAFFVAHAQAFDSAARDKGRQAMSSYLTHRKHSLLDTLRQDPAVRADVFSELLTAEQFVDFVFSNILLLLSQHQTSCQTLLEVIRRILYT